MAKQIFTPVTDDAKTVAPSSREDVSNFLKKAKALALGTDGRGGLIFALDATMSRQATWDQAQHIQAEMFSVVGQAGALDIQLVYFRGFGECRASRWVGEPSKLRKLMGGIDCRGGRTQIAKVLSHARKETSRKNPLNPNRSRVDALVFVGDAMEENPDTLCARAGELGLLGIPCFMFQEGRDISTELTFREIARLTNGAYMHFGPGSAARLSDLLKAVASYVAGGRQALEANSNKVARLLLDQMK